MKTLIVTAAGLLSFTLTAMAFAAPPVLAPQGSAAAAGKPSLSVPSAGRAPTGLSRAGWQQAVYPETKPIGHIANAQVAVNKLQSNGTGMPVVATAKTAEGSWREIGSAQEIPGRTPMSASHYKATSLPTRTVDGIKVTQIPGGPWAAVDGKTGKVFSGPSAASAAQAAEKGTK